MPPFGLASRDTSGNTLSEYLFTGLGYTTTVYSFTVRAIYDNNAGQPSQASIGVTTFSAPRITAVTQLNTTSVNIAWVNPESVNPLNHEIECSPSPVSGPATRMSNSTSLFYDFTDLRPGISYTFRVSTLNSNNDRSGQQGLASEEIILSYIPTIVTANPGDTELYVSWSIPQESEYITNYRITCTPAPSSGSASRDTADTSTFYLFDGLANGTTYTFRVQSVYTTILGTPSQESIGVAPRPGPRIGSVTTGSSSDIATINWFIPKITTAITRYSVTSTPEGLVRYISGNTSSTLDFVDLQANTSYTFIVRALNIDVTVGNPSEQSGSFIPLGVPTIGTSTRGDTEINVRWDPPSNTSGISAYRVRCNPAPQLGALRTRDTSNNTLSEYLFDGLENGISYTFTVQSVYNTITGTPSQESIGVTPRAGPRILNVTTSGAIATINWAEPKITNAIDLYRITDYNGLIRTTSARTSYQWNGLDLGAANAFTVTALDNTNATIGFISETSVTIYPDLGVPTIDTPVEGDREILVKWITPTDTTSITGYKITSDSDERDVTGANVNEYLFNTLTNGQTYTFTVSPISGPYEGSESATSIDATPRAGPRVTDVESDNGQVEIFWVAPISVPFSRFVITSEPANTGGPLNVNEVAARAAMFSGLTNGQRYRLSVQSYNNTVISGTAAISPYVMPLGVPSITFTTSQQNATATINISPPGNLLGILGYLILCSPSYQGSPSDLVRSNTNPAILTGFIRGTQYIITVQSFGTFGTDKFTGKASNVASFTITQL